MQLFEVRGGKTLSGECVAGIAKNAALPVLAACMLACTPSRVRLPDMSDVKHMLDILRTLGCDIGQCGEFTEIDSRKADSFIMPPDLSKQIRSSIFMLGPILARFQEASFTYPGGCEIGLRPIDIHLNGLRALGAEITETDGRIFCRGKLYGARIHLEYPSVGATENLLMAAVTANGVTVIDNAALEPEICDLALFLSRMGAKISGAGSNKITIEGVSRLTGADFTPMPDRIVAGTLLAAAAVTGGCVRVTDAVYDDMTAVCSKLRQMGCELDCAGPGIALKAPKRLKAFRRIETLPHPGFPTDMQAQMLALSAVADGSSTITENVFENRFGTAVQLSMMGADIFVRDRTAFVRGVERLYGAEVSARDLRGGAALVLAGLCAEGLTRVRGVEHIDRGYQKFERALGALGADIKRIDCGEEHD